LENDSWLNGPKGNTRIIGKEFFEDYEGNIISGRRIAGHGDCFRISAIYPDAAMIQT
jgi:hypothetical protein